MKQWDSVSTSVDASTLKNVHILHTDTVQITSSSIYILFCFFKVHTFPWPVWSTISTSKLLAEQM